MDAASIDEQLRGAIVRRSLVMFEHADMMRVVEPHRYGINSAGAPVLSGWLRAGYSRSDPSGAWRNYLLADIIDLQVLDAPFAGARPGYVPHDARMQAVFAELPEMAAVPAAAGPFAVREPHVSPLARMPASVGATATPPHPSEAARTQDGEIDPPEIHG